MKKLFLVVTTLTAYYITFSQPNLLQVWPVGVPLSYINWYGDGTYTVDTTGIWSPYRHSFVSAPIYDDSNNLLYQCNCCVVGNKQGNYIQGGNYLVENAYFNSYYQAGTTITQGVVAFPRTDSTWWIFNMSFSDTGWTTGTTYSPDRLYGAIVDLFGNNGQGEVISKKIPVYKGIMGDCRLTACRHANGRDWWLVNHGWNDNVFNKWLVTPDSIYGPFRDSVGTLHKEPDIFGMAAFTLDGTKYAMGSGNGLINVLDFDRCTGSFSNLKTINDSIMPPWNSSDISPIPGLCFSPSGQFLYLSTQKYITQYDTWSANIDATRVVLAVKDSTYTNPDPFFTMALSPTGKIVISNYQGINGSPYHTINYPDSVGLSCSFQKEALLIPGSVANYTLPNLVNLKLGKMAGSACDTILALPSLSLQEAEVQVFPNPAAGQLFIESRDYYNLSTLEIVDALGRQVYFSSSFDGAVVIKTSSWANGTYFWRLSFADGKMKSGKILVQH